MIEPVKPEASFEAREIRISPCENLWQKFVRWLYRRSTICTVFDGERGTSSANTDDSEVQFMQPSSEFERGFAVQDIFDLSLTWDDLRFLRSVRILPVEDTKRPTPNRSTKEFQPHL